MNKWDKSDKIEFDLNKNFYITTEKISGSKISQRKYGLDDYKYDVEIKPKQSDQKSLELHLNETNTNILYDVLKEIFQYVKKCYIEKTDKDSTIQLDISFEGLKKKWIKSGPVRLFDDQSKSIVDWVVANLDRCV